MAIREPLYYARYLQRFRLVKEHLAFAPSSSVAIYRCRRAVRLRKRKIRPNPGEFVGPSPHNCRADRMLATEGVGQLQTSSSLQLVSLALCDEPCSPGDSRSADDTRLLKLTLQRHLAPRGLDAPRCAQPFSDAPSASRRWPVPCSRDPASS